jgi:RNA polymerase sigma factor (sigma-70 family)
MRSVKFSDAELIQGLISREEIILREYYALYFQQVRRLVLTNNGTDEDARDLFQDVLMVLFQKARDENFILTCALGTFLYSVSRFLWLKELNRRKRISNKLVDHEDFVDADADIDMINEKNERMVFYRKYYEKLSESCRKVLSLFAEGYSIAEITTVMGYKSDQHTRNRRYRCKLSLINSIKNELGLKEMSYGNNKNY